MNRRYNQFRLSLEKDIVDLYFKAAIGASGAPTLSAAASKGVASITRNSAGNYTVVLSDKYNAFLHFSVAQLLSTGLPAARDMGLISANMATPSVNFVLGTAGSATDPDNGSTMYGHITARKSSAT